MPGLRAIPVFNPVVTCFVCSCSCSWVEFANKSIAKRVAISLNNSSVGGNKRDFHASDIWNMKYLHKFKWADLTEQMGPSSRVILPNSKTPVHTSSECGVLSRPAQRMRSV